MLLFSNNGSLYAGKKNGNYFFASEKYFLKKINCVDIHQIVKKIIDIPKNEEPIIDMELCSITREDFVPCLSKDINLEKLLIYEDHQLQ